MAGTTATENLSTNIIKDKFRDALRNYTSLTDLDTADSSIRDNSNYSDFIMTSWPDSKVYYPLVVLSELDDSMDVIDTRQDLFEHIYTIRIQVYSETSYTLVKIRDQVRQFVVNNRASWNDDNFHDVEIMSSTPADWITDSKVKSWEMTVEARIYTT